MWTMVACLANSLKEPVTRSSKRTPNASSRSAPSFRRTIGSLGSLRGSNSPLTAQFATAEPCMPSQRIESGCVSGNPPMPIKVVVTGIWVASANFFNSAAAPLVMMPPPQ